MATVSEWTTRLKQDIEGFMSEKQELTQQKSEIMSEYETLQLHVRMVKLINDLPYETYIMSCVVPSDSPGLHFLKTQGIETCSFFLTSSQQNSDSVISVQSFGDEAKSILKHLAGLYQKSYGGIQYLGKFYMEGPIEDVEKFEVLEYPNDNTFNIFEEHLSGIEGEAYRLYTQNLALIEPLDHDIQLVNNKLDEHARLLALLSYLDDHRYNVYFHIAPKSSGLDFLVKNGIVNAQFMGTSDVEYIRTGDIVSQLTGIIDNTDILTQLESFTIKNELNAQIPDTRMVWTPFFSYEEQQKIRLTPNQPIKWDVYLITFLITR